MAAASAVRRFVIQAENSQTVQPTANSIAPVQIVRASPHPVYYVIAGALIALVVMQAFRADGSRFSDAAYAQSVNSGGSRGIFAFSGQLTKGEFGLFMVDVDAMTIWAYEYQPQKSCLRLAAARTWRYDRYLENYNSCDLPPDAIEQMIEVQRQDRLQKNESEMP